MVKNDIFSGVKKQTICPYLQKMCPKKRSHALNV